MKHAVIVEIISVGTELLLGNIVNTNAAWLSEQCAALGLSCFYQTVVGDNEERLGRALETALERSDVVILSGGLGPTADDLTKETAAGVMGRRLYMHEPSRKHIEEYFRKKQAGIPDSNWKQAMLPEKAVAVENENGTAPGVIIEEEGKTVILLPGPPGELIPMFQKSISSYLSDRVGGTIHSRTVKICGIGESKAEAMVRDMIDAQTNPTIAPYAKSCEVHLRITARAESRERAKELISPLLDELYRRFGESIYTTEEGVTLERAVYELLRERGLTLCTAESCTGGRLSARMINVPGVSEVFQSGYVTYSDQAKEKILGVSGRLLEEYGAVSEQTAEAMALGAAAAAGADVAAAVTGIAGPGGGTAEKPVGLVYIACSVRGRVRTERYHFQGDREKIRETAVSSALILIRQCILDSHGRYQ